MFADGGIPRLNGGRWIMIGSRGTRVLRIDAAQGLVSKLMAAKTWPPSLRQDRVPGFDAPMSSAKRRRA